jgi:hypothetical protein
MKKQLYFIEVTDTYGGEANYSWVTRHLIKGSSIRGAINRFSRLSGLSWRAVGNDRYDSLSGATCLFITEYDPEYNEELPFNFRTNDGE